MTDIFLTVFAGRKENLEILLKYTDILYNENLIKELHLWNFCRKDTDEQYIKKINKKYVKILNTNNKNNYNEYYEHYTHDKYPNSIIIKCDDDIVFIDVNSFESFIQKRLHDDTHVLMFANIVNNEMCAYIQYLDGIIPRDQFGEFEYGHANTKLLDGKFASDLHHYFIDNYEEWISMCIDDVYEIPDNYTISINFFSIKSKDLKFFQQICNHDLVIATDEAKLLEVTKSMNCIYKGFTVCHLGFGKQRDTGLDEEKLQKKYNTLAYSFLCKPYNDNCPLYKNI